MTDTLTVATSFYYNVTHQLDPAYRNKVKIIYLRYNERYREKWDYAIYPTRFIDGIQLRSGNWPPSETIHTISAAGVPLVAILSSTQENIQQGIEANVREDWLQAIQLLEEGLLKFPNNAEALRELAVAKMKMGTYEEALDLTARSLEIGGPDAATYAIEGQIYLEMYNVEKAKQAYFQAVSINRDFYQGYFDLAVIYMSEKNLIAALENALKSIEIRKDFTEAYQLVAELYEEQGNLERAEFYRKEYLRLSESNR
jgi:tetratricopeptide (TPR) repeat protein